MKKFILLFILFLCASTYAQTKGITYQAVILKPNTKVANGNSENLPLVNKNVCLLFKFVDEFAKVEYQEAFPTTTDQYGMVNLLIGNGTQNGGYASSFNAISWDALQKNLVVSINFTGDCGSFTEISNQPFTAVPFAYSSVNAVNVSGVVAIENGGTNATTVVGAKTNLGLDKVENTADIAKPISAATQLVLDTKENSSNKSTSVPADGTSDVKFPSVKAVKSYVDGTVLSNISAVNAEISRATAAENSIASNLVSETNRATAAEATKEATSNKSTDGTFTSNSDIKFPTEKAAKTYADAIASSNTVALTNELNRATAAETALTANLAIEASNRINADATKAPLNSPAFTGTVTGVTSAMVGLGNVDNTSDLNKPISTATQAALDLIASSTNLALKAPLNSPAFTGVPIAPTAIIGTNTTQIATTAYVTATLALAVREVADEFIATAIQTSFTLSQIPSLNSKVKMYVNGVRISNTAYNVVGTTLVYIPANNGSYALSINDRIQFDYFY